MLIYKKILLSHDVESGTGNPESQDQKIKDLQKEIKELRDRDTENDEISKVFKNNALTEWFSDALKRADRWTINELVKKLTEAFGKMKDTNLEKENAWNLLDALKKIQATRIYTDFKEMIATGKIKRLNSFKDYEIGVLKDNITGENGAITLEDALNLYKKMLTIGAGAKLLPTDRRYFNDIKDAIEEKWGFNGEDSDKKIDIANEKLSEYQLDTLFPDGIKANDLNELAQTYAWVNDWNGAKLTDQAITLKDWQLFTAENFKTKFNTVNQTRIDKNNEIVGGLPPITLPDNFDINKFQVRGGSLKYRADDSSERNDVTAANMVSSLDLTLEGVDFVGDNERDRTLQQKLDEFCAAVKDKLNQAAANNDNVDSTTDASAETSRIENCTLNENGFGLITGALWDKNFIKKEGDNFKYDMGKLTNFLGGIKPENRREYRNLRKQWRTVGSGKWKALHCAVQILLNKRDSNLNLNVNGQWIHSKRNGATNTYYNAVKNFQKSVGFEWKDLDWIPWPKTIWELLDRTTWSWNENSGDGGQTEQNPAQIEQSQQQNPQTEQSQQ